MIPWLRRMWDRWKLWTQDPPIPFERRDYSGAKEDRVPWSDRSRAVGKALSEQEKVVRLPRKDERGNLTWNDDD